MIIFGDVRKKLAQGAGPDVEIKAQDDGEMALKALSEDIIKAVGQGAPGDLMKALKAFYAHCEAQEDQEEE